MTRLRLLRMETGKSQKEVATFLNVAPSALSQWETNKRDPDPDNLIKLAQYYDVSTDYILGKSGIRDVRPPEQSRLLKEYINQAHNELMSDSKIADLEELIAAAMKFRRKDNW